MSPFRRSTKPGTDDLGDWVNGLRPTGCDDPEHEQWRARAETAEAERDNEYAAACELGARLAQVEAERDAAQAQLARHLAAPTALPSLGIVWDEPIPEGARGTGADWPDVPGDKAEGVPGRIEVTE